MAGASREAGGFPSPAMRRILAPQIRTSREAKAMCDNDTLKGMKRTPKITRRSFAAITATAAAMSGTVAWGEAKVTEKDVTIRTPDGMADAALFYPEGTAKHAAVLVWADIMGLRPVFREMGRRLASQGYVVLVPNPF